MHGSAQRWLGPLPSHPGAWTQGPLGLLPDRSESQRQVTRLGKARGHSGTLAHLLSSPQGKCPPHLSVHQNHLWHRFLKDVQVPFLEMIQWLCAEDQVLLSSHLVVLIVLKCCSESVRLSGFWTLVWSDGLRDTNPSAARGEGLGLAWRSIPKPDVRKLSLEPPVLLRGCRIVRRACNLLEPPHPTQEAFLAGLRITWNRACDSTLETVEC